MCCDFRVSNSCAFCHQIQHSTLDKARSGFPKARQSDVYRMTMDNLSNTSLNYTSPHPLNSPGFVVFNVVMLLGVVLPVIAVNTVILVASVLESAIVKAIRLVLGSILVSCILSALGLAMYHIAGIVLKLSPVNNPPTAPCTVTTFLIIFGGAARLVFMPTFAVIVYIIVRYGKATKKKHFVIICYIVVAVLWILSFLGTSPLFSQSIFYTWYSGSLSCSITPSSTYSYIYTVLYVFFFGLITLSVTITFLVITIRYIKSLTIQHVKLNKATFKFGFFLLLGNGINLLAQMLPTITATAIPPQSTSPSGPPPPSAHVVIYSFYTLLNAALIPTPIIVLVYFKPIRERLWHWLCCCLPKERKEEILNKYFHKDKMAVPKDQVVTTRI